MSEELFRFVVARPPRALPRDEAAMKVTEPYKDGLSRVAEEFAQAGSKAHVLADRLIRSPQFVRHSSEVSPALARLDDWLLSHPNATGRELRAAVDEHVGGTVASPDAPSHAAWRERLADSLLALTLCSLSPRPRSQHLIRGLRLVELIERSNLDCTPDDHLALALTCKVVLPSLGKRDESSTRTPSGTVRQGRQVTTERLLEEAAAERMLAVEHLYADLRRLRQRYETKAARVVAEQPEAPKAAEADTSSKSALRGRMRTSKVAESEDFEGLSKEGLAVLEAQRIAAGHDLSDAVVALELELENLRNRSLRLPGAGSADVGSATNVTVPRTTGKVRLVGIGDLMLVRQQLERYELGEISHIENVLPHEHFERVFRRKDVTEMFEEEETEKTESSERELQTTARSELKAEVEKVVEEDLEFQAGVDVTYRGGMVEVSASADFSFERSTAETSKTASIFAREVVDRSVSKLQERVLERRSLRVQREVEDTSTRGIDNSESEPVVGVYRWVDKVNRCEIVNYGRRELVELVISEPAALYRHLLSQRPVTGVTAEKPEPPAYFHSPLEPRHINEYTYLDWVAQYNVTGIKPPPPRKAYVGVALEQPQRDAGKDSASKVLETGSLKVPPGYQATQIVIDYAGEYDSADHYWEVIVGSTEFQAGGSTPHATFKLTDNVPVSMVTKNWGSFTANIVLECTRLEATLDEWRIATFNAIMNRYERLRSEYEEQVEAQRVQQLSGARMATNPQSARDFERAEIKRAAVMLLTGQAFDLFGSTLEVAGAPTDVNFADADAEGRYIQFVEQAFEWRHMSYVFYPYFWGRKAEWSNYALEDDVDPLFARFLRAGAARVVVAIRPGFQDAVRYFLREGEPWNGGEPPVVDPDDPDDPHAPPYITIAQELAEQLGVDFEVGKGRLRVTNGERVAIPIDTSFDSTFIDREVKIERDDYRITALADDGSLQLDRAFSGTTGEHKYGIGPRIVGVPWEVRLPTTLVLLDGHADRLPDIPAAG